ncbi:MAG: heavy-metal-associated domain-containing protein [Phycisphaeraceae bacterium]|nr:MAG: heavy-metal-associated domain-containing protein [Phycisphaeraceae bacterium]
MTKTTTNPPSTTADPGSFTLTIDGMTCGHCVRAVTKALAAVPGVGVRSVAVGRAEITAPDGLTVAQAVNALGEAGYAANRLLNNRPSRHTESTSELALSLGCAIIRPFTRPSGFSSARGCTPRRPVRSTA